MKLSMLSGLLLIAAVSAVQGATPADSNTLRILNGYPFVEVMVNGAGPFRMLLDTGAESCMLTPKAARGASLRFDAQVTMMTVTGESNVPVSSENDVRIGGSVRTKVEFAVSALDGIRQLDPRVEGVIGQSFLRQSPYLIDYRERRLWLDDEAVQRGEALTTSVTSEPHAAGVVVPVAIGPEGVTRRLMLDSGASDLILECASACPKLTHVQTFDVRTNQGAGQMQRGVLGALEIGGTVLTGRPAALSKPVTSDRDGLLPASWFAAVYVDSAHNVVRFRGAK